ncbi:MAG: DUF192 domain-containing protein [Paracoccus sp. (in: a-proteobacteria)]|nr:DUF192 domain-containing protein [Paracoccus sp. (in: a-proteobacteria)]
MSRARDIAGLRFPGKTALLLAVFVAIAPSAHAAPVSVSLQNAPLCWPLSIAISDGETHEVPFTIELADTEASRARGLMHRAELADQHGMLFVYDRPQPVSFWMKNTLIGLDLIFMDSARVIRHIHEGAVPGDLTPIPGARPGDPQPARQYVLEIAAGEAARLGLAEGQVMTYPFVPARYAALPSCE